MYFQQLLKTYGLDPDKYDFTFEPSKNNKQCIIIPFPVERVKKKKSIGLSGSSKVIPFRRR